LTLEGVVPPDSFIWPTRGAADAAAALDLLIDDCNADPACAAAFPRFRQDVTLAFTRLARESVNVAVRDPRTGRAVTVAFGRSDLAYATRGLLYGNDALSLPGWFRRAAEGDFTAFAQAYVNRARALDDQIATGVFFGVYCAEDLPFVDRGRAEALAEGTYLGTYLLDEYRKGCGAWPTAVADASFRQPVTASVPTLLLSGRRDPVTPPRTAEATALTLPNARVLIWPYGGHGTDGFATRDCRASILREFIRSAAVDRLPVDCLTQSAVLPFRID
jgi:pimeloyl-ACP methyl ester carboxylesterase